MVGVGLLSSLTALAAPVRPGNLLVTRVGDGAAALSAVASAVFLDEYTTAGTLVQSIAVPNSMNGANLALTMAGHATAEGALALSPTGQFLSFTGYSAAVGTKGVAATTGAAINRVVGVLDLSTGGINSSTAFTDGFSGSSIRSAVTDGAHVWAAGATGGVRFTTLGTVGTSVQLSGAPTNVRRVEIFNGQRLLSSSSGTFLGVSDLGTGLRTTGRHSSFDFWFANAATLYLADDGLSANGGGLQKWTLNAGQWRLAYTLSPASTVGLRGLTGTVNGGATTLFGTSTANTLLAVTDVGAASSFCLVASAGANTAFRGLAVGSRA